jgi:hypothetical protein
MTYNKPDITVLGDAASVIQGSGGSAAETGKIVNNNLTDLDGELDD